MLRAIKGMEGNPICTCCGAVALFQDRDSPNVLYCPVCAQFAAEKTADVALHALLAMFKANSSQEN